MHYAAICLRSLTATFDPISEFVAGFWIWQVEDLDQAIALVKRCSNPMLGPSTIEIRPLVELADFDESMTPEIANAEDRLRRGFEGD